MLTTLRKFARRYSNNIWGAALLIFLWLPAVSLAIYHAHNDIDATWWQWVFLVVGGAAGFVGLFMAKYKPSDEGPTTSP